VGVEWYSPETDVASVGRSAEVKMGGRDRTRR